MRRTIAVLALLLLPTVSFAQTKQMVDAVEARLATLKYVQSLQQSNGGFAPDVPLPDVLPRASLRATSAAIRAWKYLGGESLGAKFPNKAKTLDFVMSCYDPKTGGFADAPGGKIDVPTTSVGVMAAVELAIPHDKFAKAMDYLKDNAMSFEEVRIAAAAVEAWGVKDCPFDLKPWLAIADKQLGPDGTAGKEDGIPRETASVVAMKLRLGIPRANLTNPDKIDDILQAGQWADGGYGKAGAKGSDLEATYRVMRAYMLLKERPKNREKLREFITSCRNKDGGYGTKPGETSSISGVYFAAIITKWLDDMEGK